METAVLVNVTDQHWLLERTYGNFAVAGCIRGEPYTLTEIWGRQGKIDFGGDMRPLSFPITAKEIAEDLARQINSDVGEGSFLGVFVCAGERPTNAELDAARVKLVEFYKRLVVMADQEWERTHNYMLITDVQRRAARGLGIERDWSYEPKEMKDCPACGEKVKPNVAVCRACGAVLDREKAIEFGLIAPTPSASGGSSPGGPASGGQADIPLGGELAARAVPKKK